MGKLIALILLLYLVSCGSEKPLLYDEVRKQYADYMINHDKSRLKKSYKTLIEIEDFKDNGITTENVLLVLPIFLKMEKYDELHHLLSKTEVLSQYYKKYYLNQIRALKYRCKDVETSNSFIHQNLELIKYQMSENQNDSVLYVDYYATKLYISNLSSVFDEIDSLKKVDKRFTNDFYDHLLKQSIQEMDKEIERCQ